jgi:hypothetical protein
VIDQEQVTPQLQAPSKDGSITVTLGDGGECLALALRDDAMRVTGPQLASRIMLLNTWGRLHADHTPPAEIADFERLLDF